MTNSTAYDVPVGARYLGGVFGSGGRIDGTTAVTVTPSGRPTAPTGLTAEPGNRRVTLSWTVPTNISGKPVTRHQYRHIRATLQSASWGSWTDIPNSGPGETNATSYTTPGQSFTAHPFDIEVRAVNDNGEGDAPNTATVTPIDGQAIIAPTALTVTEASGGCGRRWRGVPRWRSQTAHGWSRVSGWACGSTTAMRRPAQGWRRPAVSCTRTRVSG